MSAPRRPAHDRAPRRRSEMAVFLIVSAVGVYALGSGIRDLSHPGGGIGLGWLAIAAAAMWVLFSQMGRVHDTWPRRENGQQPEQEAARRAKELS